MAQVSAIVQFSSDLNCVQWICTGCDGVYTDQESFVEHIKVRHAVSEGGSEENGAPPDVKQDVVLATPDCARPCDEDEQEKDGGDVILLGEAQDDGLDLQCDAEAETEAETTEIKNVRIPIGRWRKR